MTSCCVFIFQDIADDAIDEALKTAEAEPLHLAVLAAGDDVTGVFIVGDTTVIKLPSNDIMSAVMLLIVSYYVFDLDYPRIYANFLSIFQTLAFGEPYLKETSKKCKFFTKKLRREIDSLPTQDSNDPSEL